MFREAYRRVGCAEICRQARMRVAGFFSCLFSWERGRHQGDAEELNFSSRRIVLASKDAPMHAETRRKERFQSFESGLALLRLALARGSEALNPLEKEGAIRRFEYCLDLAWKAAKEFLEDSGVRIAPVTPREVIRQAVAANILTDSQVWIGMLDHRNLLAHNYDGVVLSEVTDALAARYFPAMEQLREFLAATAPESVPARVSAEPPQMAGTSRPISI